MATIEAFPITHNCPPTENHANVTAGEWCSLQFKIINHTEQPYKAEVLNDFPNKQLKGAQISVLKHSINYLHIKIYIPRNCGSQTLKINF